MLVVRRNTGVAPSHTVLECNLQLGVRLLREALPGLTRRTLHRGGRSLKARNQQLHAAVGRNRGAARPELASRSQKGDVLARPLVSVRHPQPPAKRPARSAAPPAPPHPRPPATASRLHSTTPQSARGPAGPACPSADRHGRRAAPLPPAHPPQREQVAARASPPQRVRPPTEENPEANCAAGAAAGAQEPGGRGAPAAAAAPVAAQRAGAYPQQGGPRRAYTARERAAAVAEHPILHLSGCGTWRETSPATQAAGPFLPELLPGGPGASPSSLPSPSSPTPGQGAERAPKPPAVPPRDAALRGPQHVPEGSRHAPKSPVVPPRQQPAVEGRQGQEAMPPPGKRRRADPQEPVVGHPGFLSPAARVGAPPWQGMEEGRDGTDSQAGELQEGDTEVAAAPLPAARHALARGTGRGSPRDRRTAGQPKPKAASTTPTSKATWGPRTKLTRARKAEIAARLATSAAVRSRRTGAVAKGWRGRTAGPFGVTWQQKEGGGTGISAGGVADGERAGLGEEPDGGAVGRALLKRVPPRGPYRSRLSSPLPLFLLPFFSPFLLLSVLSRLLAHVGRVISFFVVTVQKLGRPFSVPATAST